MSRVKRRMSAEERQESLVATTLKLLRVHGRSVTTRQIAEAEGVAEGTIFRQFDTKEELIDAALHKAFDPGAVLERVAEIDRALPLRDKLVQLVSILQQRMLATFELMRVVGMIHPPDHDGARANSFRAAQQKAILELVADDAAEFALPPEDAMHRLRLLVFSASHPLISDGHTLTPEQIVDTILDGILKKKKEKR